MMREVSIAYKYWIGGMYDAVFQWTTLDGFYFKLIVPMIMVCTILLIPSGGFLM